MKEILNTLLKGNGVERLSLISNIFSILGVSIAAMFASIASIENPLSFSSYIQIAIIVLITIAALLFIIGFGIFIAGALEEMTNGSKGAALILKWIAYCFTLAAILFAIGFSHALITGTSWH